MARKEQIIIQCKDLIEELSLEYLSLSKQEELLIKMSEIVYIRVLERVLERLTEEDAIKLSRLTKEERAKEANELMSERVFDFDKILRRELLDFEQEIIQAVR